MAGRFFSYVSATLWVDAGLAQCIKCERSLDPAIAIVHRLADPRHVMSVAAVETRLAPVVSLPQLVHAHGTQTKPELTLRRTTP